MTNFRKCLFLLIGCATIFTSCITAKLVDTRVAKQYGEITQPQKKKLNADILISSSLVTTDNRISTSQAKTSNVLPLIVYWQWNYTNTCTLNPQIPVNNFISTVHKNAGKALLEKISGHTLEITVDKIPNIFAIDDKAHLIFFGYAFGWDNVSIQAKNMDMVVSYKLVKDNSEARRGTITIPYIYDKKKLGMFKNWKKATTEYLEQYDANITEMSKAFVQQLAREI
jgi:hypothetical protein